MGWTEEQSAAMRLDGGGAVVGRRGSGKTAVLAARAAAREGLLVSASGGGKWKSEMSRRHPWLPARRVDSLSALAARGVAMFLGRDCGSAQRSAVQRMAREVELDPRKAVELLPRGVRELLLDDAHAAGEWERRFAAALASGCDIPLVWAGLESCLAFPPRDGDGFVATLSGNLRSPPAVSAACDALTSSQGAGAPHCTATAKPRLVCDGDVCGAVGRLIERSQSTSTSIAVVCDGQVSSELASRGVSAVRYEDIRGMEYDEVIAAGWPDSTALADALSKARVKATVVCGDAIPADLFRCMEAFSGPGGRKAEDRPEARFYPDIVRDAYEMEEPSPSPSPPSSAESRFYRNAFHAGMGVVPPAVKASHATLIFGGEWDVGAAKALWSIVARRAEDAVTVDDLAECRNEVFRGMTERLACQMVSSGISSFRIVDSLPPPTETTAEALWALCGNGKVPEKVLARASEIAAAAAERAATGRWRLDVFVPGTCPSRADAVNFDEKTTLQIDATGTGAALAVHHAAVLGGREAERWRASVLDGSRPRRVDHAPLNGLRRWRCAFEMANRSGKKIPGTVWLYDLETTGLNTSACGVLEVHAEEYASGFVACSTLVRQESVPEKVTEITGIRERDTEGFPGETEVLADFRRQMESCARPVLAAHNGDRFDHVIMSSRGAFPADAATADTMREFPVAAMSAKRKGERKSLSKVYEDAMGREFDGDAHRAAADVRMMRDVLDASGGAWCLT
nr:putative exonuclease [Oceanusvirus sp.]